MPLPEPKLGLVVQYGFIWAPAARRVPPDAGKDRPCLIVDLERMAEAMLDGRLMTRVTYLPISHVRRDVASRPSPYRRALRSTSV